MRKLKPHAICAKCGSFGVYNRAMMVSAKSFSCREGQYLGCLKIGTTDDQYYVEDSLDEVFGLLDIGKATVIFFLYMFSTEAYPAFLFLLCIWSSFCPRRRKIYLPELSSL